MTGQLPKPADPAMAERHFDRWRDALTAAGLERPEGGEDLLAAVFGNSPYLSQLLTRHPALFGAFLSTNADSLFEHLLAEIAALPLDLDRNTLCRRLRLAKQQGALLIALSDLTAVWPVEQVTLALSLLADTAIRSSCRWLLHKAAQDGDLLIDDLRDPERGSGLLVLGMGKLGAFELNYSSDVDLIVFYDEERVRYQGRRSPQEFFVSLARGLAGLLDDRTADGYVFRVDLRLRPDPGSTPAAMSLLAAETYYEGFGQNWERAAMIKARPIAGDPVAGARFADFIKSFIWRKHLDFAAIQDIHSIKRQINAHRGGGEIGLKGHNVKLGRGGIREIEFFVQTQQLIWGGRQSHLRVRGTLEGLAALTAAGHVSQEACSDLTDVYRNLRSLEHRLQMVDDRQTHLLPDSDQGMAAIACFMAEPDTDTFAGKTVGLFRRVERHYAKLFEDAPPLAGPGNLVFTGEDADPDTLATLTSMGFTGADVVIRQIRGWHHGRIRATRSARAREMLTEMTPRLLQALADTNEPDAAFLRFDALLTGLPAGLQLFAMFANNPSLIDLLAEIIGNAPHLAETLTANPALMEDVLTGQFFDPLPPRETLAEGLAKQLAEADDTEEVLNVSRRWVGERKFRIGVQTLQGRLAPASIGSHLSDLADATLEALKAEVENDFARQHGRLPGLGMAVVALGKLGGREMTITSDLDLIMVYDLPEDEILSDGPKPLDGMTYSGRLAQRLLNALTVRTSEGVLYSTDMRLRPSGNKGPIATSLDAFDRYQAHSAWTWEHMALTRARVISGSPKLQQAIRGVILRTLTAEREPGGLIMDVASMRDRLSAHHRANSPWDVKHRRGGLVDVEFITQYLQLRWAHQHPEILRTNLGEALEQAGGLGLITLADADALHGAWQLWSSLQQTLRLTFQGDFREQAMTDTVRRLLAETALCADFAELKAVMAERAEQVAALYRDLIDTPARTLRAAHESMSDKKEGDHES